MQMSKTSAAAPHVLVVDDEPAMLDLFQDIVAGSVQARIHSARNIAEARKLMTQHPIELMIADINLPDGDGNSLLEYLKLTQPAAGAIMMTGQPNIEQTLYAMRHGAMDYLPKPFSAKQITERVASALHKQAIITRNDRRLTRLKSAVRELNKARRTVSQKVDILCNDLINAYGDIASDLQDVRIQESFRKTLNQSNDLEQLLCHAMDWMLKEAGYSNIAIWLNGEDDNFELGAYMKYTVIGDKKVTAALKSAYMQPTLREGFINLSGPEAEKLLQPAERTLLPNQALMSASCSYLGESLATVMIFRDNKCPFRDEDETMLRAIAPIFAATLASMVRKANNEDEQDEHEGNIENDLWADDDNNHPKDEKPKKDKGNDTDWWKRGEPPPF